MKDLAEKYVAQALEGYEKNYEGVMTAITQLEQQLAQATVAKAEMEAGIAEMKEFLGLEDEEEAAPALSLVDNEEE